MKMPRFLVYVNAEDIHVIDDAFEQFVDGYAIEEYFTLTEDGRPIVFETGMVGDPDFCNSMANRCAGITEE
jgi:hypothetical protein